MRLWSLLNTRNPLWKLTGWAALAAVTGLSAYYIYLGPKPLAPKSVVDIFKGYGGKQGTFTEQLGEGRVFVLDHETIAGDTDNLELTKVRARLEEPEAHWRLISPLGQRRVGSWTLMGPMEVEATLAPHRTLLGKGSIPGEGPALRWEKGVWTGLSPLHWQDLAGRGKGRWSLPAGWQRDLQGRFTVDRGPVTWEASEPGALRRIQAERLWLTLGFTEGHLEQVQAEATGGRIWAGSADLDAETIRWSAPIRFEREDGWHGTAEHGQAPRPVSGAAMDRMEMTQFLAERGLPGGTERLKSEGVRWTTAGLRLEGQVSWEQPVDREVLVLKAPRVLIREGQGPDLPEALPVGEAWAEGTPVLTWGARSLSAPSMQARRAERTWKLQGPVHGRGEHGTFRASSGQGSPRRWEFQGPITATALNGGSLRGDRLAWEGDTWNFTGNLATWTRLRERLSGARIVWKGGTVAFPEGITGSLAGLDGDFLLRADRAEYQGDEIRLSGRVECQGQGWRLHADRISVRLGQRKTVKQISAQGSVTLRGRLGEGWGESLELEPDPVAPKARWQGRVRGVAEVAP